MRNLNSEELRTINGGSDFGYYIGYYGTKGMTYVMDGLEWVGQKMHVL